MSAPELIQIWSLDTPSTRDAPAVVNFDVWAINNILRLRASLNNLAFHLSVIPRSETRLRDEGIIASYKFARNILNILKSCAHELDVAVPDIPDVPEDWNEEASVDSKALAAEIRPRLAESVRPVVDWIFGSRDRNPGVHWTSRVAVSSVAPYLLVRGVVAVGGIVGGSKWESFMAQVTGNKFEEIAGVINEEVLRIRAQPGSGWNEEEARRVVTQQFGNLKDMLKVGA